MSQSFEVTSHTSRMHHVSLNVVPVPLTSIIAKVYNYIIQLFFLSLFLSQFITLVLRLIFVFLIDLVVVAVVVVVVVVVV